jgi:hypothetical protein
MPSSDILERLQGGDRRSIGRAGEIVQEVLADPSLFSTVFSGLLHDDRLVRMRAADVTEKVTAKIPALLQPYKRQLLYTISKFPEKEIRWHVAQMLPRLKLTQSEQAMAVKILLSYLEGQRGASPRLRTSQKLARSRRRGRAPLCVVSSGGESSIVRTFSMQALSDLAARDLSLLPEVLPVIERLAGSGTPAMVSRGRMLLKKLRRLAAE